MQDSFSYNVFEYSDGGFAETSIRVIAEIPLVVYLNGHEVVTLLCTGKDPAALALGFLKSEGLLTDRNDIQKIEVETKEQSVVARLFADCNPFSRDWADRLTGLRSATVAGPGGNPDAILEMTVHSDLKVSAEELLFFMHELDRRSGLFRATGGCHNAALCEPEKILIFCEDIGRHNAIDMICGKCLLEEIDTKDKFIVTTGRIGSEILIRALRIGVPILASRSAATCLAIDLARKTDMTLIGYVRKKRVTVYNHAGRIRGLS